MGHRPEVLSAWDGLKHALVGASSTLSPELKEQVRRTLALRTGCEFCASLGRPAAEQPSRRESLAVAFADAVAMDHNAITDGQLDLVALSPQGIVGWAAVAARLASRRRRGHPRVDHHTATEFHVRADRPQDVQLDGDPIGKARAISAEVVPGSLVVRVGAVS